MEELIHWRGYRTLWNTICKVTLISRFYIINQHPLDTIKSKMQIQIGYSNQSAFSVAAKILKTEGFIGYKQCNIFTLLNQLFDYIRILAWDSIEDAFRHFGVRLYIVELWSVAMNTLSLGLKIIVLRTQFLRPLFGWDYGLWFQFLLCSPHSLAVLLKAL